MSWAEDDFQSEKMDRSRHRKSREGIASVPEAANPPQGKNRAPCGGLAVRERERERETLRQGRKKGDLLAAGGAGWGVLGQKRFFEGFCVPKPFFGWKFLVPRGAGRTSSLLISKANETPTLKM